MPKPKERKEQTKGASLPIVPILQKFLRTYEKHCARFQASVSPAIRRDLQGSIEGARALRGFTLIKPDDFSPSARPISLEPLLTAIQDEHYMLGKKICIWGLQLSNAEIARLASLLELRGKLTCPFATVEIVDCKMDLWSLGRLGKALQFSSLRSLVLDYCKFGNEEIERLFSSLEKSQRLQVLSLCYCGLGPWCGSRLGVVISQCAICELRLDGNYLQCSGALALLRPMAEYAELQGSHPPPRASPHNGNPPQVPPGIKKKAQGLVEAGPWLVKLHLADNGIDGKGEEDHLLEFTRILTCVIKYSAHLQEIDLGNNALGEKAAAGILAALRARRTGRLPVLKVTVTPRISSDTFRSIWKHSNSSRINHKKKKKVDHDCIKT
uniref:uncharacterized protein LOC123455519 n=1 Tax=Jaculus jaculus TaxID=51337 RepID=UPI001E1B2F42|nr:uncharacterized protein LOC123455519 [Jaculus jaculus]